MLKNDGDENHFGRKPILEEQRGGGGKEEENESEAMEDLLNYGDKRRQVTE